MNNLLKKRLFSCLIELPLIILSSICPVFIYLTFFQVEPSHTATVVVVIFLGNMCGLGTLLIMPKLRKKYCSDEKKASN
jgi:hypothetical protein